jgi:isopentenyldiphosphate isomerase
MEEECILVDKNDKIIGSASKRACHLVNPDGSLLLHRAFSVFAFNSAGQLLLQKRSQFKVRVLIIKYISLKQKINYLPGPGSLRQP